MSAAVQVRVDRALCQNHGQCVYAAPDVFAFDDDEELVYDPAPAADQEAAVRVAVSACPVRAITVASPDPMASPDRPASPDPTSSP